MSLEAHQLTDRLFHAFRRRAARRRVLERRQVGSVLFVCHGNICRSPFAAAVFAREVNQSRRWNIVVKSAGFVGPGRQSPGKALTASARRNIDLSSHKAALVTPATLRAADLVIVMDSAQATMLQLRFGTLPGTGLVLGDLDPLPITGRTIVDPWGREESVYEDCYARIERCVNSLVQLLASPERVAGGPVTVPS